MAKRKSTKHEPILTHAQQVQALLLIWDAIDASERLGGNRANSVRYALWRLESWFGLTTKAAREARKLRPNKPFGKMDDAERQKFWEELEAKLANTEQPEVDKLRKRFEDMDHEERRAHIGELMTELRDRLDGKTLTPEAEPESKTQAEPEPEIIIDHLPTAKMRRAIERFDDLTDEQQLDHLQSLWGES